MLQIPRAPPLVAHGHTDYLPRELTYPTIRIAPFYSVRIHVEFRVIVVYSGKKARLKLNYMFLERRYLWESEYWGDP